MDMSIEGRRVESFSSEQIDEVFMALGLSDGTTPTVPQGLPAASPPPDQPLHLTVSAHSVCADSD